jgi:hypothetical protein
VAANKTTNRMCFLRNAPAPDGGGTSIIFLDITSPFVWKLT